MSLPSKPTPGFYTVSIFAPERALCFEAMACFEKRHGKAHLPVCEYSFTHTDYYQDEMGHSLHKILAGFPKLSPRENMADEKLFGIKIEKRFAQKDSGKDPMQNRRVNIDPGFLSLENFILLTCKNFSHKAYLGKGVFSDLTLIYESKDARYRPLPWSFKDYTEEPVGKYLLELRKKLRESLREL
ncbi:MAG: DUF4416 family protein [Spirochaetia bacterium]|nr:DUF4416 family protein [Spirochaetia bacterium]